MFVFFKLTPNIGGPIVSYCFLSYPYCILLFPTVSYCILLYPTVSYCILLYYPTLLPFFSNHETAEKKGNISGPPIGNSGPPILKLRSANSDRNSGPPSSNLRRNPARYNKTGVVYATISPLWLIKQLQSDRLEFWDTGV